MPTVNSIEAIQRIVRKVPYVVGKDFDKLIREYRAYQCETEIKENWFIEECVKDCESAPYIKWKPLDKCWTKVFKITNELGNPKYCYLTHLVKGIIILALGNTDVERGFSTNTLVTSAKAAFSPASIVALRTTKDALCTVGSNVLRMPITPKLLRHVQNAHVYYKAVKEEEARKSEQEAA